MSSLSTYDFSTVYTTLLYNLIKDKQVDLIERTFQREGSLCVACNDRTAFFTSDAVRSYNSWFCQKVCEALTFPFEAFNSTSRYQDDLLNIDSGCFDSMVNRIYP